MIQVLTSESTVEPVTLKEMKVFLRMDETDSTAEAGYLKSLISGARKEAENICSRSFVTSARKLILDEFENTTQSIDLPMSPLSSLSTNVIITYVKDNTAGDTTTINATAFTVDYDSEPGNVSPSYGNDWPTDIRCQSKAITIAYVSGYIATKPVPEIVKTWIKMRAGEFYESREPFEIGAIISNHKRSHVDGLLDPYTIITITS